MTENVQLEQSVSEWKDEALGDSFFPPQSLKVITFIVSAGVFGFVFLAGGLSEILGVADPNFYFRAGQGGFSIRGLMIRRLNEG